MIKKYNLINNLFGWLSFVVAAIVYLLTIEPTASFWDCGEFISSAYKLEVGHPPGAPFFMLTGKFFSLFAGDPSQVAVMINAMSALLSAATILFLFWTVTHLAKKLIAPNTEEMSLGQLILIMGSGLIGALTYTFTDTFWFSAVEGEVYAYSSMFTALVFWLILKWENRADEPRSDKWLVLIAYAMGLSIGVHLLNLLCIPAIVLVYYFKKNPNYTTKGLVYTLIGSFALIVVLMYGIIPGFAKVGGWFELLFVNTFRLSYNTGVLFYFALLLGVMIWSIYQTFISNENNPTKAKVGFLLSLALSGIPFITENIFISLVLIGVISFGVFFFKQITLRVLNTSLLCLLVILIGYSSFLLIPIRSMANTPMDQNSPESVFTLASYLNREQYGDRPLVVGRTYASQVKRDSDENPIVKSTKLSWDKVVKADPSQRDKYVVMSESPTYEMTEEAFLPRMYSTEPRHLDGYRVWADVDNFDVKPTFFQNLKFFWDYQLKFMYFRYFMWNFSGRQNDIQGNGELSNGNWITGIPFVDEAMGLGPQDNLPPFIKENKGHNYYYGLPFLLGVLGILFQLRRGKKGMQQFLVTFMLFFMTGIAIILYLNQQPQEVRERDYAYAGSFYAYCIWIGLGVAALYALFKKIISSSPVAASLASVLCLFIPVQMASQNWDDHDRSNRYTMRDFGSNYLVGLPKDAILFTMGDNDTFPLWYAQEVEGIRTDVRVCNLMYLQTDWYVDQMKRQAYESSPLPISWSQESYTGMRGAYAYTFSEDFLKKIADRQYDAEQRQYMAAVREYGVDRLAPMKPKNYADYYDVTVYKDIMPLDIAMTIAKTKESYTPKNNVGIDGLGKSNAVIIPSTKFYAPINVDSVDWKALGTSPKTEFVIDLGEQKNAVYRQDLMTMEMLNNINKGNWERPIYHAITIGSTPLNLANQTIQEGINRRIVPGVVPVSRNNTAVSFDNLVNKYKWGNAGDPKVYMDENNMRMVMTFRHMFADLVNALIKEGDYEKAEIALDRCMEVLPGTTLPRDVESIFFIEAYAHPGINKKDKAEQVALELLHQNDGALQWYARLNERQMQSMSLDISKRMAMQIEILSSLAAMDSKLYEEYKEKTDGYYKTFMPYVSFDGRNHPLLMLMGVEQDRLTSLYANDSGDIDNKVFIDLAVNKNKDFVQLARTYNQLMQMDTAIVKYFRYPQVSYLNILLVDESKLTPSQKEQKQELLKNFQ